MSFNYRLIERTKRHFIDFFQKLFILYEQNKTSFADGYYKLNFSKTPKCLAVDNYDFKYYPVILVGITPGTIKDASINKFKSFDSISTTQKQEIYGGFFTATLNFQIRARSADERNNIADTVIMYLNSKDTRNSMLATYGIYLIGEASFSGDSAEDDPQTNVKNFITNISQSTWGEYEETGETNFTVSNVLSYFPDVYGITTSTDTIPPYTTFTAAPTGNTIALSSVDGYYNGYTLRFTSNIIDGVSKTITDYVANTNTFIINDAEEIIPINTTFELYK